MQTTELSNIAVKNDDSTLQLQKTLLDQANSIVIKNDEAAASAKNMLDSMKLFLETAGTYHDEEIEAANRLHKLLCGKRNAIVNPVKTVYDRLKNDLASYIDAQRRKAEEAKRKAEAEARRIEDEKKAAIQAKIDEENRIIREAREAEERRQREKDAELARIKNKDEREKREKEEAERRAKQTAIDEQERIKAESKVEKLEAKKEAVFVETKPVAAVSVPAGVSVNYAWDVRVIDKSLVPLEYMTVDISSLERVQKVMKGKLVVPGVEFIQKAIGSNRRSA